MSCFSDDDIRWLLDLLEEEQLAEIEVEEGECAVAVRAYNPELQSLCAQQYVTATAAAVEELPDHIIQVLAPVAGTFYITSSPDAAPFVTVGDIVEVGDPLGLVEAMKLYHEITSPTRGRIAQISVENQEHVEAEQQLMLIDRHV
jgi:acetyl-CoA carboxylase biotin carboxyl carrier protein